MRLNILLEDKIQGAIKGHIREKKLFPNQQHETPLSETLQRCLVEILENPPSPELQQDDIAAAFLDRLTEKVKNNELTEDVLLKTSNLLKK